MKLNCLLLSCLEVELLEGVLGDVVGDILESLGGPGRSLVYRCSEIKYKNFGADY